MSFSITLQTNNSEKNVLDKILTDLSTVTGTLRDETSIMNPVIRIEGSIPIHCNYMTIPEFARSYFITDIKSIRNNLYEVYGHVDVLTTYKNEIRNCEGIIARQQNNWNLYIDDGVFKTYQNRIIGVYEFDSGFNVMQFVLAVAGA